jgi:hypothetical protein
MEPVFRLALEVLKWGALMALSLLLSFWISWLYIILYFISSYYFIYAAGMFKFVWENSHEKDGKSTDIDSTRI